MLILLYFPSYLNKSEIITYLLSFVIIGNWKPAIGDPTFFGWLTTIFYIVAAALCGFSARRSDRISASLSLRRHLFFWWSLTIIMLIIAINKQLDLQTLFLLIIKKIIINQGWYSQQNIFMLCFIAIISIFSFSIISLLVWTYRFDLRHYGFAFLGIMLFFIFIIIRSGFYYVNAFNWKPFGIRIYYILEIASISCIGISALITILGSKK